jgi:O-antigen/teichoic acid export membrane protein
MPTRKIYTNTLAQIAGKVATALISIAMIKILTGYLDVAGYGLYSKLYNYLSIFAVIADLGLYTITVRELTKYADDEKMVAKISSNVLSLRTFSGVLIIFLSLGIAPFLSGYDSPMAMIGILIASLFTLLGLINSSLMSYLQATLRTEFSFIANTSGKLLTFGMILMFAGMLFPIAGMEKSPLLKGDGGILTPEWVRLMLVMLAGLAGNALMTGLTWWYANRWHKVRFGWDTEYIKHILKISLPYWVALFLNVIFFKVDTILLSVMERPEIADTAVALYSLPMKIVEVGMMYGTVFLNSLLPVLTTAMEKKDDIKVKKLMRHAFLLLSISGASIAIFLFAFAPWVIQMISTEAYIHTTVMGYTAVDAMRIVVWIFLVYFVSSLYTYALIARGEQKRMMYINAVVAILNIIGNIIFIPLFSFIGSAWVTLVTQIFLLILTWWFVREKQK